MALSVTQSPGVPQPHRKGIFGALAVALADEFGAHSLGLSKQHNSLVREMRAQIQQQSAPQGGIVFPGHPVGRAPAVDGGLEMNQAPERAFK